MKTTLLDIGGTFIKCSDGRCIPVNSAGTREEIASALREAVAGAVHLAVAIPGPFDYGRGIFLMKHKFAAVYGESFASLIGTPSIRARFRHDVVAQLEGAVRLLGLEEQNVALVTLGTGLGFAHTVKGEVQLGTCGSPARGLWDLPIPEGGILEDKVSSRGIRAAYGTLGGDPGISPLDISLLARKGDAAALEAFAQTGARLGEALRDVLSGLGVSSLLLGGQIAKSMDLILAPLRDALPGIRISPSPEGAVFEGLKSLLNN